MRLLRSPLLHVLIVGLLADIAIAKYFTPAEALVVDTERLQILAKEWQAQAKKPITPEVLRELTEAAIEEDVIFNEARRRGMVGLPVVQNRLTQLGMFLKVADDGTPKAEIYKRALDMGLADSDQLVRKYLVGAMSEILIKEEGVVPPTEREVSDWYLNNQELFTRPERIRIDHVFFNGFDDRTHARARAAREELVRRALPTPDELRELGDAYYGQSLRSLKSIKEIKGDMGSSFATRISALPPHEWSEPIVSTFGLHLAWVDEIAPPDVKPLDQVRRRINHELTRIRREEALQRAVDRLKRRYAIVLDVPDEVRTSLGLSADAGNTSSVGTGAGQ
jgi:hypothetical protein